MQKKYIFGLILLIFSLGMLLYFVSVRQQKMESSQLQKRIESLLSVPSPSESKLTDDTNVVVLSNDPGYSFEKSADYPGFTSYLSTIGFWKENAVVDPISRQKITAKKLTVLLSPSPQMGDRYVTNPPDAEELSSFSYTTEGDSVIITVHIGYSQAQKAGLQPNIVLSAALMRATYLIMQLDAANQTQLYATKAQELINQYLKKPFFTLSPKQGLLQMLLSFGVKKVFAYGCEYWHCGLPTYGTRCDGGTKDGQSCALMNDCPNGFDAYGAPQFAPCVSEQVSCSQNYVEDNTPSCSSPSGSCPSGQCVSGYVCSCSGNPISTPTRTPTPTNVIPGCSCGGWSAPGACGTGGCAAWQRPETRTCSPANCTNQSQCIDDFAGCNPPTSTPTSCNCSDWTNGACGAGGCAANQRQQTRTCNPGACDTQSQCVPDNSCGVSTLTGSVSGPRAASHNNDTSWTAFPPGIPFSATCNDSLGQLRNIGIYYSPVGVQNWKTIAWCDVSGATGTCSVPGFIFTTADPEGQYNVVVNCYTTRAASPTAQCSGNSSANPALWSHCGPDDSYILELHQMCTATPNVSCVDNTTATYGVTASPLNMIHTNVQFPTWNAFNGADDRAWYLGSVLYPGAYYGIINANAHPGDGNQIITHVYGDYGTQYQWYGCQTSVPRQAACAIACLAPPPLNVPVQNACSAGLVPVTLSWDPVPGATGYYVRVGPAGGGTTCAGAAYCPPGPQLGTNITLNLAPGTYYDWWVHTANSCPTGYGGANFGSFTTNTCPIACLAPPTLHAPSQAACSAGQIPVTFSWDPVPGATGYYFRVGPPGGGITCAGAVTCSGTPQIGTSAVVNLTPGVYYDWWVHTANACPTGYGALGSASLTANICPTPTMAFRARAVGLPTTDISCAAISDPGNTNYFDGTNGFPTANFTLNPGALNQSQPGGGGYAVLHPVLAGPYNLSVNASSLSYQFGNACLYDASNNLLAQGAAALNNVSEAPGQTRFLRAGYLQPVAWSQTVCGDVYVSGGIGSRVPEGATNPQFMQLCNGSNTAGVVTYGTAGTGFDFSFDTANDGRTMVSPPFNFLVNEQFVPANFTTQLFSLLGSPTTPTSTTDSLSSVPAVAAGGVNYYRPASGTLTLPNAWNVPAGRQLIIYVEGNLQIEDTIRLANAASSFVAFIVTGNVTVSGTVGSAAYSATPTADFEGIMITNGGYTVEASNRQYAVSGMVIASTVSLNRDLGVGNALYPPVLFSHNPNFIFSMPLTLQNIPILWQEVAP